jgi:ABC-type multidrug transport system fused ATPase/permease subunit
MKGIQNYMSRGVLGGIRDIGFLLIGFLLLSVINFRVAILYFFMALVSVLAVYFFNKLQRKRLLSSRAERNKLVAHVSKSFQRHARNIERDRTGRVIDRFNRISETLFLNNVGNSRFESLMQAVFSVLQFIMIGFVLFALTFKNFFNINAADALVFVLIMLLMNAAMKRVLKVPSYIQKGRISFEKIDQLMNKKLDAVVGEADQNDDDYE